MRKLLTAMVCATMILSVGGCGGSEKENKENNEEKILTNGNIDDILKGIGYKASCDDDKCTVYHDDKEFRITSKNVAFFTLEKSKKVKFVYSLDIKSISYNQDDTASCVFFSDKDDSIDCEASQEQELKRAIETYQAELKDIGIDEERMIDYLKNLNIRKYNGTADGFIDITNLTKTKPDGSDSKSENDESDGLRDPKIRIKQLGYSQNDKGYYIKRKEESLGDFKVTALLFDFDKNSFAMNIKNDKKVSTINWSEKTISFYDQDDKLCLYDLKNNVWLDKDMGIENEIKAIQLWTEFVKYCTNNKIMIDIE